ncbi:hypothetical protein [Streptomyces sp. NPDC049585]|uniref:hypothetical protein n=1 Tax=Streptomyces sp. NPDC049585 TaxID=3155154 RepID=UPI003417F6B1
MCIAKTKAKALAALFAAATGCTPRTEETRDRIRVEVELPTDLGEQARRTVLMTLSNADRYGHDRTRDGAVVWAELDRGRDT